MKNERVAVVTGGAGGIGLAVTRRLARRGHGCRGRRRRCGSDEAVAQSSGRGLGVARGRLERGRRRDVHAGGARAVRAHRPVPPERRDRRRSRVSPGRVGRGVRPGHRGERPRRVSRPASSVPAVRGAAIAGRDRHHCVDLLSRRGRRPRRLPHEQARTRRADAFGGGLRRPTRHSRQRGRARDRADQPAAERGNGHGHGCAECTRATRAASPRGDDGGGGRGRRIPARRRSRVRDRERLSRWTAGRARSIPCARTPTRRASRAA